MRWMLLLHPSHVDSATTGYALTPTASMYWSSPRSPIRRSQFGSIGFSPPSTVFLPRCFAQYAAPPAIVLKPNQYGSSVTSHPRRLFGSFHSSTHSKCLPNFVIIWSRKSANARGSFGGADALGDTPQLGGV